MCEYLAGSIRSDRVSSEEGRLELKRIASESGYNVQLDDEIPATIRKEIGRWISHTPPFVLLNVTSDPRKNCIEEVFIRELRPWEGTRTDAVPFFRFLRRLFGVLMPTEAVLISVEGDEQQWFPLERYRIALSDFLTVLYEYRLQEGYDKDGVYHVSAEAPPFDFELLGSRPP